VERVSWARDLTRRLLAEPLPRRWAHSQGVGRKAESIAYLVGEDAGILVCAAWLHDIGYAPALVTTGMHGWSRNPIYLGMFLVYGGIGLTVRSPWILLLMLPLAITIRYGVVAREEGYLELRFGDTYREYTARVRRWL